jgi:hypothetical protein
VRREVRELTCRRRDAQLRQYRPIALLAIHRLTATLAKVGASSNEVVTPAFVCRIFHVLAVGLLNSMKEGRGRVLGARRVHADLMPAFQRPA